MINLRLSYLIFLLVFLGMQACTFKKMPASKTEQIKVNESGNSSAKSLNEIINNGSNGEVIAALEATSRESLKGFIHRGDSILDLIIKRGDDGLLSLVLTKYLSPMNFNEASESILNKNVKLKEIHDSFLNNTINDLFYDYLGSEAVSRVELAFDELQVTTSACKAIFNSAIGNRFYSITGKSIYVYMRVTDDAASILNKILSTKQCASLKSNFASDEVRNLFELEIIRQARNRFESSSLLQFFATLNTVKNASININQEYQVKADPRILLFLSDMTDDEWNEKVDKWWPFLTQFVNSEITSFYFYQLDDNPDICNSRKRKVHSKCINSKTIVQEICAPLGLKCYIEPYDDTWPSPPEVIR
ncbi:hypothetical protein [Bdellovibrio reynosensis]|uniref:Lipoprotein n=1 Tax=Bdellovibrio reynosensis TaxID=2835041 RepID=A0ABY4C9U5_9BACT|nr:hypothetical protein [Bdellovibrio reynosensis]UOF00268.1 hypothetical protein MNR06_11205 [Bdellovibrio reynosensis]